MKMLRVLVRVGLVTAVCSSAVFGAEEDYTFDDSNDLRGSWTKREEGIGQSIAPVLGYEPTYRFVYGAAYFIQSPRFSLSVDVNTNIKKVYQGHLNVHQEFGRSWYWDLHTGVTRGYQPYYGSSGNTKVSDFVRLWGTQSESKVELGHRLSPIFAVGLFVDGRSRTEELGEESPKMQVAPNESTVGVGLFQEIDTRDNKDSPRDGFVFRTDFSFMPTKFSTVSGSNFVQAQGDFIVYKEILNQVVSDVVAAFQLSAGTTFGEPTFAYEYKLGGANKLRGYLENRFRGRAYYLQQTELRFPIWKLFSGAAFLGFGNTAERGGGFADAKMTYGIGLRIGLPPDWISKIRIDYGVGQDQGGIFANFGHTF